MRRIVYVITDKYGIEVESTFSYTRAVARTKEGCTFETTIRDCPRKLSKEDQKSASRRNFERAFKRAFATA